MKSGNIAVFKPLLDLVIAASIINELDKKNAMNKQAEYTPLNRQERKSQEEIYKDHVKELEQQKKNLIEHLKELENIIEAHLIGWCIVAIGAFCIFLINVAT